MAACDLCAGCADPMYVELWNLWLDLILIFGSLEACLQNLALAVSWVHGLARELDHRSGPL